MTQKLCLAVAETADGHWTDERVDEFVERLFLSEEARKEGNLKFVQDKVLTHPQRRALLGQYKRVLKGKEVQDKQSLDQNQLKLSGLVKAEHGVLRVRNEIYRHVFNLDWVKENSGVNWTPILAGIAGIAVFVALLAVSSILYNNWVDMQVQDSVASFYQANSPAERLTCLAKVFRARPLYGPTDYDYRARELFYGLSRDEQPALFAAPDVQDSDLIEVISRLYPTLADVDGTGHTTPLLQTMDDALDRLDETEKTIRLRGEISSWLQGRELVRLNQYADALEEYTQAIEFNGGNPATRYERARVLIALSEYQQALNDLDQIMAIARSAPEPTPTPPSSTGTLTSTPTTASTVAPRTGVPPTQSPSSIESIPSTQTPSTETVSLTRTSTISVTATPTSLPTPTKTPIPTPTPVPAPIRSEFGTLGQMRSAVRNLIYNNTDLVSFLASAVVSEYPNLQEYGLVPTPTATPIPFPTTQPLPVVTPTATPNVTTTPSPTPYFFEFIVNREQLNIYAAPGENYIVLDVVHRGDRLTAAGRVDDGSWWQVDYFSLEGWVIAQPVGASIEPTLLPVKTPPSLPTITSTPTSTTIPTPSCPLEPDGEFETVWSEELTRARLGCPIEPAHITGSAHTRFEHGFMYWREDRQLIYVFYDTGYWEQFGDLWDGGDYPSVGPPPSPYLLEPVRGFGLVWREQLGGPEAAIGWATEQEQGGNTTIEDFERGVILKIEATIYLLYRDTMTWQQYYPGIGTLATPTANITPSPTPYTRITVGELTVRTGPGEDYPELGVAQRGYQLPLRGRSEDGAWWQVDYLGWVGWIPAQTGWASIDPGDLSVVPTPPRPVVTLTPTPMPTPTPTPTTEPGQPILQNPGFVEIENENIPGWNKWAYDNFTSDEEYDPETTFITPLFKQTDDPVRFINGPTLQIDGIAFIKFQAYVFQTVSVTPDISMYFQVRARAYADEERLIRMIAGIDPNGGPNCDNAHWSEALPINQRDGVVLLVTPEIVAGSAGQVTVCLRAESPATVAASHAAFFDDARLILISE